MAACPPDLKPNEACSAIFKGPYVNKHNFFKDEFSWTLTICNQMATGFVRRAWSAYCSENNSLSFPGISFFFVTHHQLGRL